MPLATPRWNCGSHFLRVWSFCSTKGYKWENARPWRRRAGERSPRKYKVRCCLPMSMETVLDRRLLSASCASAIVSKSIGMLRSNCFLTHVNASPVGSRLRIFSSVELNVRRRTGPPKPETQMRVGLTCGLLGGLDEPRAAGEGGRLADFGRD